MGRLVWVEIVTMSRALRTDSTCFIGCVSNSLLTSGISLRSSGSFSNRCEVAVFNSIASKDSLRLEVTSILQKGIVAWPHPFRPPWLPSGQRRDRVIIPGNNHTPHRRYIGSRTFMEGVDESWNDARASPQTHSPDGIEPEGDSVLRSLVYVGATWPSITPWSPRLSLPLLVVHSI